MAHRVAREHPVASQLHATILTNYHRKIPILSEDSMFNKLLEAWQEYIRSARIRMQEHLRPESQFLKIGEDSLSMLRSGVILVLPGGSQSVKKVPSGVIH